LTREARIREFDEDSLRLFADNVDLFHSRNVK
jgi:hypothetical protein